MQLRSRRKSAGQPMHRANSTRYQARGSRPQRSTLRHTELRRLPRGPNTWTYQSITWTAFNCRRKTRHCATEFSGPRLRCWIKFGAEPMLDYTALSVAGPRPVFERPLRTGLSPDWSGAAYREL